MSYRPLKNQEPVKEEPKEEVVAPNYEAELAAEKARNEEIQKRLDEKAAEYDRRERERAEREELERQYAQQPQMDQEQAMFDLGITEEEVASNPAGVMKKLEQYMGIIRQESHNTVQQAGKVLTGLAEDNHRLKIEALTGKEFFQDAKSDIEAYYKKYPEKKIPGVGNYESPQEVYEKMVGKNWQVYSENMQKRKAETQVETPVVEAPRYEQTYQEAPRPNPPSGPNIHKKKPTEVNITQAEQEMIDYFNRTEKLFPGGAAEWKAIQSGRVLPKTKEGAMDWQKGWSEEDRREATGTEN